MVHERILLPVHDYVLRLEFSASELISLDSSLRLQNKRNSFGGGIRSNCTANSNLSVARHRLIEALHHLCAT
jgi:hypothetical protein